MASNGPLSTPFENPLMSTPGAGEATTRGAGISLSEGAGGAGLQGTPFEKPLAKTPGQSATPNSSELPSTWTTTGGIPDDPGAGSTAAVADGVATPNTPAGNMTGGHGTANTGVGKV